MARDRRSAGDLEKAAECVMVRGKADQRATFCSDDTDHGLIAAAGGLKHCARIWHIPRQGAARSVAWGCHCAGFAIGKSRQILNRNSQATDFRQQGIPSHADAAFLRICFKLLPQM